MTDNLRLILALALALPAAAQDPPALTQAVREMRAIRTADSVVVARMVQVHDSPGIWCGVVVTRQEVTYRIERVIDGDPMEGEVRIGHLLVANSPLVATDAPFLRPDRFWSGARAVLCVSREDDRYVIRDETFGVRLVDPPRTADPAHVALIGSVFRLPALRPYLHLEREDRRPPRCALNVEVPLPFDADVDGHAVAFLPAALLRDEPHLEISRAILGEDHARIEFALRAEGVVGHAVFSRDGDRWTLVENRVAER